ncbi:hypothetical protein [Streptomyces bottropensis]|uniref:hypothetical protein n=1 Tax=Streptomyces bottropensis TaxID=42235 RepID=UPI0036B50D17
MRPRADELGLGERLGSYPVVGVSGGLLQICRRVGAVLCAVLAVTLYMQRPPHTFEKSVGLATVVIVWVALLVGWRRLSARLGVRRCCLYTDGVVVTDWFGRAGQWAAWSDVSRLTGFGNHAPFLTFHRLEIWLPGRAQPIAILTLGSEPKLVAALQELADLHELPT